MDTTELEYVGFWARVWAAVIDTVLVAAILYPLLTLTYGGDYWLDPRLVKGPMDFVLSWVLPAVAVVLFWTYRQATPGKMAIAARIVDAASGGPPSTRQLVVRYLGYFVSTIPFGLGLLWVAFDPRKQGWHDRLADTVVVRPKHRGPVPVRFGRTTGSVRVQQDTRNMMNSMVISGGTVAERRRIIVVKSSRSSYSSSSIPPQHHPDGRRSRVSSKNFASPALLLSAALAALVIAGCGGSTPPPAAEKAATEPPPPDQAAEELAVREAELARKEAELNLKLKEQELARREAELAAREAGTKKPATAAKPATAKPAATAAGAATAAPKVAATPPKPVVVPAGTKLSAELVTPISSKTNRRGDRVEARVLADVMVDGKRAIPAGTILSGTVTERVSGSKEIGKTPMIGVTFDTLAPDADRAVAMSAGYTMTGKSESGRDTAKIAGGAVAGAVIGHQVDSGSGAVIGGLLGAAAGTAAAKNTGTEVELPAGTTISVTLDNAVEVKP